MSQAYDYETDFDLTPFYWDIALCVLVAPLVLIAYLYSLLPHKRR